MRIVLADDHALFRDGVSSLLEAWGHQVVGRAADGRDAVDLVGATRARPRPDGRPDAGDVGRRGDPRDRRESGRRCPIVMLTVSEDEEDLFAAIQAGARGYLLKDLEARQLRAMIDAVARGEAAITPATAARIIRHLSSLGRRPGEAGARPIDRARARRAPAGHRRTAQQGDRGGARDHREHGQVPPPEHPREAPRARAGPRSRRSRCARGSSTGTDQRTRADRPCRSHPFECGPPHPARAWRPRAAPADARSVTTTEAASMGYRIDIDHTGCINCGICMDTCPVEALDMSRPTGPGIETAGVGQPQAWMMEHPVQVGECIGCGICIGECPVVVMTLVAEPGETALAARQGPIDRPVDPGTGAEAWLPLASVTRESLKREHPSPWGDLFAGRPPSATEAWQVWRSMKAERPDGPEGALPGRLPGRHGRRSVRRADRRRALRRGLRRRGRGQPVPVGLRLDLHRAVRDRLPARRPRRADRDPDAQALRRRARRAARRSNRPRSTRTEKVGIVGGGPAGMSAAYYLARLGYPVTVFEAMPVPGGMMAIGIPSYRLPRDVLQAEIARIVSLGVDLRLDTAMGRDFTLGDLEQQGYRAVFLSTGASKSRRLGVPGDDAARASSRRRSSSSRSTSARIRDSAARPSSSAVGAPRWTRRARPGGAARRR